MYSPHLDVVRHYDYEVLLMADPWLSRSIGFALSCAATAGIVLLALYYLVIPWRRIARPLTLLWLLLPRSDDPAPLPTTVTRRPFSRSGEKE